MPFSTVSERCMPFSTVFERCTPFSTVSERWTPFSVTFSLCSIHCPSAICLSKQCLSVLRLSVFFRFSLNVRTYVCSAKYLSSVSKCRMPVCSASLRLIYLSLFSTTYAPCPSVFVRPSRSVSRLSVFVYLSVKHNVLVL